ncbi:tetraacyldisaccharide 4'-kinase [Uliginosibacterium sp. H3]|uniref:Tetraacyldisaccharide 4'-kinase n=1 Tax=Uliginosibacterium silvisoli TaxID=3114758 RepID=A0ABU6K6F3_9RHOO|nr:tetraacyldisaccharide 4'-kinase [Uliginosibacterium sp. H3]
MPGSTPSWWATRGPRAWLQLPFAALFACVAAVRKSAWHVGLLRAHRLSVPVVVVGNVAVGGSGKTPVVIWLADALRQRGWAPGIISRGYGGRAAVPTPVWPHSDPVEVGDEPVLISRRTGVPMWIGRDRPAVGRALLAAHPQVDVIISDDGLQHYQLARDVEIVVLDERILGNAWPLPAGPLREPLSRVRQSHLAILHGESSTRTRAAIGAVPSVKMTLAPGRFYRLHAPEEQADARDLKDLTLKALAGIGRPERFFESLRALGLEPRDTRAFPDHYVFSARDLALDGADALLMTEKDAIKCRAIAPEQTWVLPVDAHIDVAALEHILECLDGPEAA